MDQYRGYTVAGMFLVNFVGGISAFHYVLKHNNGFFSYADSIMPGFIFCAGFSYRLTAIRRFAEMGTSKACWSYVKRSLALVLVSVSIFTFNADIGNNWNEMQESIGLSGAFWRVASSRVTRVTPHGIALSVPEEAGGAMVAPDRDSAARCCGGACVNNGGADLKEEG